MQNPINLVDPDGMEVEYAYDPNKSKKENRQLKREFKKAQKELNRKSPEAKSNWNKLVDSKNIHTIHLNEKDKDGNIIDGLTKPKEGYTKANGTGTDIYFNLNDTNIQGEELGTNIIGIGHEEGHAFRFDSGLVNESYKGDRNDPDDFSKMLLHIGNTRKTEEIETSHIENIIRAQVDPTGKKIPLRKTYNNIPIYFKDFRTGKVEPTTESPNVIKKGYDYYKKNK